MNVNDEFGAWENVGRDFIANDVNWHGRSKCRRLATQLGKELLAEETVLGAFQIGQVRANVFGC